jgi:acetyl esterase/lipase
VGVEGPFPTILTFHGGGFRARSKSLYTPIVTHFTDQGYALVASNYRFALADTPYPAQVEDAFCALGWIYSQAEELGFDTSRSFIMGDSAGGYLAAMLGTVETPGLYRGACPHEVPETGPIRGVVVLYGFYDLLSLEGHPPETIEGVLKALMGAPHAEVSLERLEEMSPKSWIDGSEPPFMVVHGTRDRLLASWLSEEFAAALEAAGVQVTLLLIEAQHGFAVQPDFSPPQIEALTAIDAFLGSYSGVGP